MITKADGQNLGNVTEIEIELSNEEAKEGAVVKILTDRDEEHVETRIMVDDEAVWSGIGYE